MEAIKEKQEIQKTQQNTKEEKTMKRHSLCKLTRYLFLLVMFTAISISALAPHAYANVESYRLSDYSYGPVGLGKENFNKYFIIMGRDINRRGGYLDISSRDEYGREIARHRFYWEFSRDVSYLRPDPRNNLRVEMFVDGGTNRRAFMKPLSNFVAAEIVDMQGNRANYAETRMEPYFRVYDYDGWKVNEILMKPSPDKYAVMGFVFAVGSPVGGGKTASYAIAYEYKEDMGLSAEVTSLWSTGSAKCGNPVRLWAYVKNTGSSVLPSDAAVWFYVRGSGKDGWVAGRSVANMQAGEGSWRYIDWTIPTNAKGWYKYWAIVWSPTRGFISPWSSNNTFTVYCP